MDWPDFFPDNCPYEDAQYTKGTVFRLIRGQIPKQDDFKPHRQTQRNRQFNQPECIVCGLSIYTDLVDANRLKRRIPSMRRKLIAVGILSDTHGKMLQTPSAHGENSHHTWWVPLGVEPWQFFQVIDRPTEVS